MSLRQAARAHVAQQLAARTERISEQLLPAERPIASSAGDLGLREPAPPNGATLEEIKAYFPAPDGDFVLTDKRLIYYDPRGHIHALPLAAVARWRQRRSDRYGDLDPALRRRILEIDLRLDDGRHYVMELGKGFARQVRSAGRIRRR